MIDHYMMAQPAGGSREPVEQLNTLFEKEVKEAPAELLELYQLSQENRLLSERWESDLQWLAVIYKLEN